MTPRVCEWCRALPLVDPRARFCSQLCRQAAFRLRRRHQARDASPGPGRRFGYADPPYPGRAVKYYGREPSFAGEVDHAELVARLTAGDYCGWALSTAWDALRDVLPLCPRETRVCPWVKPIGVPSTTAGIHCASEALLVVGGRQRRPGVRDWLRAQPARGGGELVGRKPLAFAAWLFDLLGMEPGDELDDLYPGTGLIGRAWSELSSRASSDGPGRFLSSGALDDAPSLEDLDDTSPTPADNG